MTDSPTTIDLDDARGTRARLAMAATFCGIAGSVAANKVQDWLDAAITGIVAGQPVATALLAKPAALAIGVVLAFATAFVAFRYGVPAARTLFLKPAARISEDERADAYPALVMAVSLPGALPMDEIARIVSEAPGWTDAQRRAELDRIARADSAWSRSSWQQTLRMLRHNDAAVRAIYFVLTQETLAHYATLLPLVEALAPRGTRIMPARHAAEHGELAVVADHFTDMVRALQRARDLVMRSAGCGPEGVLLDATSGTKVHSIAAAVLTLNSDCVFGYVGTRGSPREGKVSIVDAGVTR